MLISDPINRVGYFWLPGQEQNKAPGTLRISDGGDIRLEIVGTFDDDKDGFSYPTANADIDFERIVGHVEKDGFVTLEKCFYTSRNIWLGGISKSEIVANMAILGASYDEDEEVLVDAFRFSIEGLNEWLQLKNFSTEYDKNSKEITAKYVRPENVEIPLQDDLKLMITFGVNTPGNSHSEIRIKQTPHFELVSDKPITPEEFAGISRKITNLVCFAADDVVSITDISATSSLLKQEADMPPVRIRFFYGANPLNKRGNLPKRHKLIFSFNDIKDDPNTIFTAWLEAYEKINPVMWLYFASKSGSHSYLESRFLALTQALETYHRRTNNDTLMSNEDYELALAKVEEAIPSQHKAWVLSRLTYGNEISLSRRIKFLLNYFGDIFGDNSARKKLCRKIVNTRNYLTHYDEGLADEAAKGMQIWVLCRKMETLLQLHLLKELKFSDERIKQIALKSLDMKHALDLKMAEA